MAIDMLLAQPTPGHRRARLSVVLTFMQPQVVSFSVLFSLFFSHFCFFPNCKTGLFLFSYSYSLSLSDLTSEKSLGRDRRASCGDASKLVYSRFFMGCFHGGSFWLLTLVRVSV